MVHKISSRGKTSLKTNQHDFPLVHYSSSLPHVHLCCNDNDKTEAILSILKKKVIFTSSIKMKLKPYDTAQITSSGKMVKNPCFLAKKFVKE